MANRITGMYSGLDTESLIQDLVKAKSTGVTKLNKQKTTAEWKQEAWGDLNKKIKSLYQGVVSNLRFSSAYSKKKTTVSNNDAVSVITGENAMNSVQTLSIKSLAKSGYLTGQKLESADGSEVTGDTKISELALKDKDGNPISGLADLSQGGSFTVTVGGVASKINITSETTISELSAQLKSAGVSANFDDKNDRLFIGASGSGTAKDFTITADNAAGFSAMSLLGINVADESATKQYESLAKYAGTSLESIMSDTSSEIYKMLEAEKGEDGDYDAAYAKLMDKIDFAANVSNQSSDLYSTGAVRLRGENAAIELNGVRFESDTNSIEVNGITYIANSLADDITVTTQDDTDGIYDVVKNFIKEYNSVINEIDKLYNAASTKLEPLTDEEKDAVTDSEVEKLEKTIKDSLLRKDETLGGVFSALKEIMAGGIDVNGNKMYLNEFGISQLSYFSAADGTKNAYHIDGDSDDENTSGNTDKLKSMIASDSATVISFFSQLSNALYTKMSELSSASDQSSYGSFFNDKQMKTEITDYTSKISDAEQKLQDFEDKYYDKFAKMETALAKMQDKTSYISSLFGQ